MDDTELTRLHDAAAGLPAGEFHLPELYGPDWDRLWIGDKVKTGRAFLQAVRAGRLPGIEDTGRKAGGGRIYRKL
ncbi:MAG: DUF1413 domain-containing protein [Rhodobacteraceae bacterium]|jgi:hypothetical protein|uniref:Putative DUF1413 protein n=1 Tax=Salipiger profundus TaxID=1229727 RepID=A0A1U7D3J9_9RHOB|nr:MULTISPECIES: DUF1413 domain-containing protein [Salipiger]APX22744.1 putative DUF1413 protein [Salipiger profundus]MAB05850.1 DUF1413 domain-containing protein [Paracoccaceae bacterium]GGA09991.1 hypothetical protein GCM10011326_22170 [Salipiger profundus]SFC62339.1 protein of unknown function [Salipiger profundus]